jgi:hypothetical protein
MHGPRQLILLATASVFALQACSTSPVVEERLDPLTGVTVTRTTSPLVLYRDHSASAAHARDFVNMGPILVNRMGEHAYFVWLGIWSTMQDRNASLQRDGFESIVVYADGEPLQLELQGWTIESIGVSEPVYVKPVASAADAYYRVTRDQVRLISQASEIRLQTSAGRKVTYEPWNTQSASQQGLRSFLEHATDR